MKNELGITKGEFFAYLNSEENQELFVKVDKHGSAICKMYINNKSVTGLDMAINNAQLIRDAFNVANETGKTPRQLADDNKVLLEALQNMRVMYWQWIEQHPETQGYKWAKEALSAIKQVTE